MSNTTSSRSNTTASSNNNDVNQQALKPLSKEDLIWASLDADEYDKYYKKPPPYVPSQVIYKEYTYSLGEIPFGEKAKKKPLFSPLLPKELSGLPKRQRSQVLHGATKRKFGPLKIINRKTKTNISRLSPMDKYVGRRKIKRNYFSNQKVPPDIRNEPIDWNHPEYVNTANLFYKCSNPDTFFRGNLARSKLSTLLKDRKLEHHGKYERVSKQLRKIVESGIDNMPGFDRDSAYLPTGIVRSKKNDPSHFLPGYGSTSDVDTKRLELSILRHIATRERVIKKLRDNCHTSLLSGDGTFAMRNAIKKAKKALRGEELRKSCDSIRGASLKVLLEINEWRLCMKKLEEDAFYEMNFNVSNMTGQQQPNNPSIGDNISIMARKNNETIADYFEIGMPITPLTPNTLDFSKWTPQDQYQSMTPFNNSNNSSSLVAPSTGSNQKIVYSRIKMPPRSFFYKGENYTTKMKHDLQFIDDISIKDGDSIGVICSFFPTSNNPLLFPASLEELAGNMSISIINNSQVPLRQSDFGGLNMYDLREAASILLEDYKYLNEVSYFDYVENINHGFVKEIDVSTQGSEIISDQNKVLDVSRPNTINSRKNTPTQDSTNILKQKMMKKDENVTRVIRLVEAGTQTDPKMCL